MPYPSGAEIIAQLRYDPDVLDVGGMNALVADAIDHLREASGTPAGATPPETATAREFVTEYATGHALKRVLDTDAAEKLLVRADKLLDRYGERDYRASPSDGLVGANLVANQTTDPLWSSEEFGVPW